MLSLSPTTTFLLSSIHSASLPRPHSKLQILWNGRFSVASPHIDDIGRERGRESLKMTTNSDHRASSSSNHRYYYPTPSYRSSPTSSASFRGCCCCLFLLFSFLALLALAIFLVIILAVKPKKPQFELQQVTVQSLGITTNAPSFAAPNDGSTSAATTASLSLTIMLLFTAVNPNKVGIKYGESRFTVMYRGIPLGKASVPGFYQEAHSVRQVQATIIVDRVNLLQADAADLIQDASVKDRVELRIFGNVGAKIRIMNFDSPSVQASVNCAVVISPRKQSLTEKRCGFDGLNV